MSVFNPNFYVQQYMDSLPKGSNSDIKKGLAADLTMMNAQWNYDNAWYNAHQSASAKFDEYRNLGMNPYQINQMLLGNPNQASPTSAGTVAQSGGVSGLTDIMDFFATGANAVNRSVETDIAAAQSKATIDNLNSQTALNNATAPTIAPEAASRTAKNYSEVGKNVAEVGVLNERQKQIVAERNLTDIERQQIGQVMSRYDEVTTAQINNWTAQTALYWEQKRTLLHEQNVMDADALLKGAQTSESMQRTANLVTENTGQAIENAQQLTTLQFISTTGIPMNANDIQTIEYYEKRGEYDKAENYMMTILDCAASREAGVQRVDVKAQAAKDENKAIIEDAYYHPKTIRESALHSYWYLGRGHKYKYPNFGRTVVNP